MGGGGGGPGVIFFGGGHHREVWGGVLDPRMKSKLPIIRLGGVLMVCWGFHGIPDGVGGGSWCYFGGGGGVLDPSMKSGLPV